MTRLLTIPTRAIKTIALEERRAPDDDIIPMDDAPTQQPVVDAGVGTGGAAAQAENVDALAATTSPEAPAAAEADLASDAAADSSVTDAPSAPAADNGTSPPAAGDTAAAAESDVTDPAVGEVETMNNPADEPAVTNSPAVDPDQTTVAAPAGEEQTQAVVNQTSDAVDALPDSPVDAGVEPVEPAAAVSGDATGLPDDVAPEADTTDLGDAASDSAPVEGEAPVSPEGGDMTSAASGVDTATDISSSTVPDNASSEPAADVASPADAATDSANPAVTDPVASVEPAELTSAWVDGVAVDAEEVKQQLEGAANDVADADNVTEELEDAAMALEELAGRVSENLADENPAVSDTTVNLVRITAEKSLHRVGEVLNLPVSMESAATPHQRLMLTLESISEKAKQVWEAIKKALAAAWQAVVNFFKTIFDSAYRVKQAIIKLRQAVKNMRADDKPSGDKLTNAAAANAVGFEGFSKAEELVPRLSKMVTSLGAFLENSKAAIHNAIIAAGNELVEAVNATENHEVRRNMMVETYTKILSGYSSIGVKLAHAVAGGAKSGSDNEWNISGVVKTTSGELPGGYVIEATDFSRVKAGFATDTHVSDIASGRTVRVIHNPYEAKEAPLASEETMLTILDETEKLVDAVIASKDSVSKFESDIARFRREAQAAVQGAGDTFLERTEITIYIRAISGIGPSLVKQNSTLISMVVTIANGVVKYVTGCCKMYPSFGSSVEGSIGEGSAGSAGTGLALA